MLTRKDFNALAAALSSERASPALIEAVATVCANEPVRPRSLPRRGHGLVRR